MGQISSSTASTLLPGAFGNPTAQSGLVAVNGVALTAMRSDAAPAINQGIAPVWTGLHQFSGQPVRLITDNQPLTIGAGNDLAMVHDGTDSTISNATGILNLNNSTRAIQFGSNVTIRDDNPFITGGNIYNPSGGPLAVGTIDSTNLSLMAGLVMKGTIGPHAEAFAIAANGAVGNVYMAFYESNALTTRKGYFGFGQVAADDMSLVCEENAPLVIQTAGSIINLNTGGGTNAGRFDTNANANETRFMLYDVTAGALVRVSRGAVDSGGVGFRVLRVPN